ncbi:MAG: carboxypeptidase regulatory-like domain-containing protein [Chloroflexi bacterium]|nr:carboxypeptidase regulatory-like domain-containing protein [Chloroflexota bacterium]
MSFVSSPKLEYAADGKPRERAGCGVWVVRSAMVLLALISIGLAGYIWFNANLARQIARSGALQGIVLDARNQPLPEAVVYIASAPEVSVTTESDGSFQLRDIPSGKQTVIIFYAKLGQEIEITLDANSVTQVGTLVHRGVLER